MKKILEFVLAFMMLLSVLAGCNSEKPVETQPKETKPAETKPAETQPQETEDKTIAFPLAENLEVSVMAVLGNASYSLKDNVVWQYFQETSNMTFNTLEFAPSEALEKMNLLMSSGEYTDVLFKCDRLDLDKYGMDGILIPLEDLIREYCPNLSALLDERDGWNAIAAPDGHIYAIPAFVPTFPNADAGSCWWINKGWLDKLGLEEPKSVEDLYTVLKAFKEQDPNGNGKTDEIPMTACIGMNPHSALLGYFDHGLSYSDFWMVVDGQMEYLPTTDFFKENMLELYSKMYVEGLIDPEVFTQDRDQFRATCGTEDVIYGMLWDSSCAYFADSAERLNWVSLKPFNTENFAINNGIQEGGLAISDKCKNPEIIMAWIDQMYTEEGGRYFRLGLEGITYKINEDGTWESIKEGFENRTYQGTLMGSSSIPCKLPDLYYDNPASELTRHSNRELYSAGYGVGNVGTTMQPISLTEEEYDEYSIIFADVNAYVENYIAECTVGIVSVEETWADFQTTLKEMHVDRMIEIYRAAYERAVG